MYVSSWSLYKATCFLPPGNPRAEPEEGSRQGLGSLSWRVRPQHWFILMRGDKLGRGKGMDEKILITGPESAGPCRGGGGPQGSLEVRPSDPEPGPGDQGN